MSKPIDAIYENGVFKPLTPPNLPEHTRAKVIPAPEPVEESDDEVSARRKAALLKMLEETARMPQHQNNDGWSVANNADDLLYGGPKGPA